MIRPKAKVPDLELPLINDTQWTLSSQEADTLTMLVFYRGIHCPICKKHLEDLANRLNDFSNRGVHLIAISCDTEEKAKATAKKWDISELPIGYGMTTNKAREWGLYISQSISDKEPETFSEPGLFLIRPNKRLYASAVQSMPFARPHWEDVIRAIDYIKENDYPERGGR